MRKRALAVVIAGTSAALALAGSNGAIGRGIAVERASAVLASLPGLAVGRISASGDTLAIDDIDYRTADGTRIRVGRLALPGGAPEPFGLVAPASAAPAGIVATDLTIAFEHDVIAIPRIEALGTYLTADRLKALLDPGTGQSLADRLSEMTAASLVAPSVTVTGTGSDGGKAEFDAVAMTDVVGGRIGATSIGRTSVSQTSGGTARTIATTGPVGLVGLDLPFVLRIAQTSRTDRAETPQTIYGSLSVRDVSIAPDTTGTMTIGSISADGFRGRPLMRSPADVVALLERSNDSRTPDDAQTLADVALDAARGFSLDHLEWDALSLATTDKQAVLFRLGRMVIDGLSPTRVEAWVVDDLDLRTEDITLTMARMALHTPDGSASAEVLAREIATAGLAMDRTTLMGGLPQDGSLSVVGLHLETPDAGGSGNGVGGRSNVLDMPVVGFASVTDRSSGIATATAHAQATYALPAASPNPGFAALVRSGFTVLDARADSRAVFDPKGHAFRLDPLTVAADKLGRISLSVEVGNVPYELLARGRPASDAQAALEQVVFKGFTLDVRNDGLVAMALPMLAASANTSVPMFRAGAKTQADLFIGQTLGNTPAAARLEAAVDAFVDDPHDLRIAVTAPEGLSVAEIRAAPDPRALLDRVGIEAAANR